MNFAKLVNLAMDCKFGKAVAKLAKWFANLEKWFANLAKWFANLAMGLQIWQWIANLAKWFAKLAMWFAKLAMWFAKLAMRNFAKVLKFLCETNEQCMWLANFAMRTEIANWLPTHCEIRNGCELIAKCLPKFLFCCFSMPLVLSSTASHFFHFSFVFPLIFGLVDG